jgi:hypothetical protein
MSSLSSEARRPAEIGLSRPVCLPRRERDHPGVWKKCS